MKFRIFLALLLVASGACRRSAHDDAARAIAPVSSEVTAPRAVVPAVDVAWLVAGGASTCVGQRDRSLHCWGQSDAPLFADLRLRDAGRAAEIASTSNVATVAASMTASCVLFVDGAVTCWGTSAHPPSRAHDEIGVHYFPPANPSARRVEEIAVHDRFACVRLSDQTVWCWGQNGFGQLGDGTTIDRDLPVQARGLHDVRQLALGHGHACACKHGGAVWCWGRNEHGQIGDGTTTDRHVPTLTALGEAVQVATGEAMSCARHGDGSVRCWGSGKQGQNGEPTLGDRFVPTLVPLPVKTAELALGDAFACARGADARVRCWGQNDRGQLGRGVVSAQDSTPGELTLEALGAVSTAAIGLAAGGRHACARLGGAIGGGETIACWGAGERGELGDERAKDSAFPTAARAR